MGKTRLKLYLLALKLIIFLSLTQTRILLFIQHIKLLPIKQLDLGRIVEKMQMETGETLHVCKYLINSSLKIE